MKRKKISLINNIQLIFLGSILLLSGIFLIIQISSHNTKFKRQSEFIQENYSDEQKAIVKREVERVVNLINSQITSMDKHVEEIIKEKVYEAYAIAENIYNQNSGIASDSEIIKMIKDALRPIRFENNRGYFFITSYSGLEILFADRPEMEGKNLIDLKSSDDKYVIRDMIEISKQSGEGLYEYQWTKPGEPGNDHKKISFVKHFAPYDWIIGTGLYIKDLEERIQLGLLQQISETRFGQEGYIFVNTLDGYALVANGNLITGQQKLWEVFNKNPDKTKDLFQKEYDAAIKPDGGYIYYSMQKLSDSQVESPKSSFIQGIPEYNWLIGAGVYLDDIEAEISNLQDISYEELKTDVQKTVYITLLIMGFFFFVFFMIGKRLQNDFHHFTEFFNKAVFEDVEIDLDKVKFHELTLMADRANRMQTDKFETQQKLREEEEKLRISEKNFRLLAENSKDMIFRMSFPSGKYEYVSPASKEILGYTPEEIMDEPYHVKKSIHPDWREWLEQKLKDVMNGSAADTYEYQIINKDGNELWVTQKNALIRDEKGKVFELVGRLSDDTQRKKIEEQLNHSYRMDAIGQLAGGVAHDFNNVLAGIINAAQVLKSPKREIDEKGKDMVDLIMKAAVRAADLTAKLSTFSRKRTLSLKPVDMNDIINETVNILKRTINKNIDIVVEKEAVNSIVFGDGSELQSAILNLGINASHSMVEGGRILIRAENKILDQDYCDNILFDTKPGKYIQVLVRDNGSGITKENLKKIFEPFFSTKEQGKGTGLGLATVYGAVLDHHGAVEVESKVGEGTTFYISIPNSDEKLTTKIEKSELISGTGRILLVDDEDIIRFAGKNMLEDMGYTVIVAENGKEAVALYEVMSSEIDLVIMDMIMPVMNGTEAFYKMKKKNPDSKIIIMSGHTRNENIDELKEAGLADFIKKPFTNAELNIVIENVMGDD